MFLCQSKAVVSISRKACAIPDRFRLSPMESQECLEYSFWNHRCFPETENSNVTVSDLTEAAEKRPIQLSTSSKSMEVSRPAGHWND